MSFIEELEKETNPWRIRIGNYLLSRDDMKDAIEKKNKSLKECFEYILIELSNNVKEEHGINWVSGEDEDIFEMAVHYYDEDDIKVGKRNFKTNADGSVKPSDLSRYFDDKYDKKSSNQDEIDKAVSIALEKYKIEEKEKEKRKKEEIKKKREEQKAKKEADRRNNDQLDIFEMLGNENEQE